MEEKLLKELKQKLLSAKESLEKELKSFASKDRVLEHDYDAKFPNFGDEEEQNAAEVAEYDRNLDLEAKMEVSLKEVNEALAKIEQNGYGLCEKCGQEISPERLKALPYAKKCLSCEQSEKK